MTQGWFTTYFNSVMYHGNTKKILRWKDEHRAKIFMFSVILKKYSYTALATKCLWWAVGESKEIFVIERGKNETFTRIKMLNKQPNCLNITANENNAYKCLITRRQLFVLLCCFYAAATCYQFQMWKHNKKCKKDNRGIGTMASHWPPGSSSRAFNTWAFYSCSQSAVMYNIDLLCEERDYIILTMHLLCISSLGSGI